MIWCFLRSCRLIPCLRHFGIKFYAYGPLAYVSYDFYYLLDDLHFYRGGLLSGKILDEDSMKNTKGGRWDPSVSHMAPLLHEQCAPLLPILRELKELLVRKGDDLLTKTRLIEYIRMCMIYAWLKRLNDGCNTTVPSNLEMQLFSVRHHPSKWKIILCNGASLV